MPRANPRFKKWPIESCNKLVPICLLSENDERKGLKYPHEKNKNYYHGCLKLNDEYRRDEATIRWLTLGYVSVSDTR